MLKQMRCYSIIILILISILIFISSYGCNKSNGTTITNQHFVVFEELKDTIFIKSKTWGLLGNHNETYITSYPKKDFQYDSIRDLRFVSERTIFFEKKQDSLLIYLEQL
jgi:hypothetical protein